MANYPYNPALKEPGKWMNINLEDASMSFGLKLLVKTLNDEVNNYQSGFGNTIIRKELVSYDNNKTNYYEFSPKAENGKMPVILYLHGGGFFLPIQKMMMYLADKFAYELKAKVFLLEYRLTPEYKCPVQFFDCKAMYDYIVNNADALNIDTKRIVFYGESAGAALSAGLNLYLHNSDIKGEMLVYPVLDNKFTRYSSFQKYNDAAWPLKSNITMWKNYLNPEAKDLYKYLIPMSSDDVGSLPKTYIEPQEIDILHDEAVAFYEKLKRSGVDVILNEIKGSYHGFDADYENPFVKEVIDTRINVMKEMLGKGE